MATSVASNEKKKRFFFMFMTYYIYIDILLYNDTILSSIGGCFNYITIMAKHVSGFSWEK